MIKVSFNYDPETNTVSGVSVEGATAVKTESKPKATKTTKKAKATKIILKGSSLQLTEEAIDLLGVAVGDRLCVRFDPAPVLVTPEAAKEPKGGNLITKSLTVSVKGKTGETLAEHGTEFEYSLKAPGFLQLGSGTPQGEQDKPKEEEIDSIIDDTDFLSGIEGAEEVDFTIDNL